MRTKKIIAAGLLSLCFFLCSSTDPVAGRNANVSHPNNINSGVGSGEVTNHNLNDQSLNKKVVDALKQAGLGNLVKVTVNNGRVTLSGTLTNTQHETAAKIAEDAAGIENVVDHIDLAVASGNSNTSTNKNANTSNNTSGGTSNSNEPENKGGFFSWESISNILKTLFVVIGVAVILGSIAYLINLFIKSSREREARNFEDIKKQASSLGKLVKTTMTSLDTKLDLKFEEQQKEIDRLHRRLRQLQQTVDRLPRGGDGSKPPAYPGHAVSTEENKEEVSEFPISAQEYLQKMGSGATVIKYDFQNDILVKDPNGDSELVLVSDFNSSSGQIYIVPKVSNFKIQQDFYTYYEKYYNCFYPKAGDVWIINPAVADKVSGGWKLRDKGILEVR